MTVDRRQLAHVGSGRGGELRPRPSQGRLKPVFIAQTEQAAVLADEVELRRLHDQAIDPARLLLPWAAHRYLASSRSALR